jgi:hypothetical protein
VSTRLYDHHVRPVVDPGRLGRAVADASPVTKCSATSCLPCSAPASALAVLEVSKDPRVREALSNVRGRADRFGARSASYRRSRSRAPGRYIPLVSAAEPLRPPEWPTRPGRRFALDEDELLVKRRGAALTDNAENG